MELANQYILEQLKIFEHSNDSKPTRNILTDKQH